MALVAEARAAFQKNINTYFVVLNNQQLSPQPQLDFYNSVASAQGTGASVLDATSTQPSNVLQSFQSTIAAVATCVYDLPPGIDTTATLSVTVPPATPLFNATPFPAQIPIGFSSACNAQTQSDPTAQGWNIDNGRILVCGQSCNNVKAVIGAVALAALQQLAGDGGLDGGIPVTADGGAPATPDVPIDVTMPCGDAGTP
jgi:hypothetical protein